MKKKLVETNVFLSVFIFTGGFLGAYGLHNYGSVGNANTGNMVKLGVSLANGDFSAALNLLLMLIACITGAALCELVRAKTGKKADSAALLTEIVLTVVQGLFFVALPEKAALLFVVMIGGYQLNLFRTCPLGKVNTTIMTGNLRLMGRLVFKGLTDSSKENLANIGRLFLLLAAFVGGSAACTLLYKIMGHRTILVMSLILAGPYLLLIKE